MFGPLTITDWKTATIKNCESLGNIKHIYLLCLLIYRTVENLYWPQMMFPFLELMNFVKFDEFD